MDYFTLLYAILSGIILIGGFVGWAIWEVKSAKFREELREGKYKGKPLVIDSSDTFSTVITSSSETSSDAESRDRARREQENRDAQDAAATCSNITTIISS